MGRAWTEGDQDQQRTRSIHRREHSAARRGCVGARLLPRLPEPARSACDSRSRSASELGIRSGEFGARESSRRPLGRAYRIKLGPSPKAKTADNRATLVFASLVRVVATLFMLSLPESMALRELGFERDVLDSWAR